MSTKQIAISHYTAREAEILYNADIPAIYLGANTINAYERKKKNKKYSKVYNQIPENKEKKNTQKKPNNPPLKVLSVSRITPYKGFHLLIDLVRKVEKKLKRPLHLTIAGSTPSPSYLKFLKSISTSNTEILTNVTDDELSYLYSSCDIYVTCDRYLFFGMPILEAALLNKPSLALDYCAAREIIKHGETGFVARNQREFQAYLAILVNSATLRKEMGQAAKKHALAYFNWQNTAEEYINFFKTLNP